MAKKLILMEYKGGIVCGAFDSMEEVNKWFEKKSEYNSSLRDPQWYPHKDVEGVNHGQSLVFLHYYCTGEGQWLAEYRLTEVEI